MRYLHKHILLAFLLSGFWVMGLLPVAVAQTAGQVRLKELVMVEGAMPVQLTGYGLVVGLDRTGDRARGQRGAPYTVNSIANMLRQFGIAVDPAMLASRNVAAVMVITTLDPFAGVGSSIDVTVSSLGDARSLSGGILLQTPLMNPLTGKVHLLAQGPVSTSAVLASGNGSSVKVNHSTTGRIPNGGMVSLALPVQLDGQQLGLILKQPDFTNAVRIQEAINAQFADAAQVEHAGLVRVTVPANGGSSSALLATMESLTIDVDIPARVVINERTGTIVAGGNVRISEVMVTYGSLIVATQTSPAVSQPAPFSEGETVASAVSEIGLTEEGSRSVVLAPNTDVNELAAALNELGLTARDVIAIFQAIKRAGALQGELVIL